MDGVPLGKPVTFVPVVLWSVLHVAKCTLMLGQFPGSVGLLPMVPTYNTAHVFRQFVPQYRQPPFSRSFYFSRPDIPLTQTQVVGRRLPNNYLPRVHSNHGRRIPALPSRIRSFRTYNKQKDQPRPHVSEVLKTRPQSQSKTISMGNAPLTNVMPHPKPRNMKATKRMRYRLVAKAKSFSGILKGTSLDVTKV